MSKEPEAPFVATKQFLRFVEFCDACRRYRYIGLCYGPPGVGKTLSARQYARWDKFESCAPSRTSKALQILQGSDTILYTPGVVNSPGQLARDIKDLRRKLHSIALAGVAHEENPLITRAKRDQARELKRLKKKYDLFGPPPAEAIEAAHATLNVAIQRFDKRRRDTRDPTSLILVDEADRLKMAGLEQLRATFDEGGVGLVLIGMPGLEKRLTRYPQLYSRVGFVHEFRPLDEPEMRALLVNRWTPERVDLPNDGLLDEPVVASILRITGGNFRLLHRLLTQTARIVEINRLSRFTAEAVDAARESLVIGTF